MDGIRATPYQRPVLGGVNELIGGLLGYMRDPRRTQQMQGLAGLLESTGIPKTVERMAYGEPLTNVQMANVPLLRPETAEALLTLLPTAPAATKAAKATKGLPVGMSIKDVSQRSIYPQEEALRLAQQRAALPKEQYGLGLPPNNTPEMRAAAMFQEPEMYHATDKDFLSIIPSKKGKLGAGVYMSPSPKYAEKYVDEDARVLPLLTSGKFANSDVRSEVGDLVRERLAKENPNFSVAEWKQEIDKELMKRGYSGVDMDGLERTVYNPENIRSRFAAFDPWRRTAAIAATMGVAAPDLLAAENPLTEEEIRYIRSLLD